jgi:hypothetical protein
MSEDDIKLDLKEIGYEGRAGFSCLRRGSVDVKWRLRSMKVEFRH